MLHQALRLLAPAVGAVLLGLAATAQPARAPVELTSPLLDKWLLAMRQIGAQHLEPAKRAATTLEQQASDAALKAICTKAGFADLTQCACTSLYASVLMIGLDSTKKQFINPAIATERRIKEAEGRAKLSRIEGERLERDRRLLAAFRVALPKRMPAAHLELMGTWFRTRMPNDPTVWREFAVGVRATETRILGNECAALQPISTPPRQ